MCYVQFFSGLKPPGRVIVFAVVGPSDKVEVGMNGMQPMLLPSCKSSMGMATPAIRINAVVDGVRATGNRGYFNEGDSGPVTICSADFGPAMRKLAQVIKEALGR